MKLSMRWLADYVGVESTIEEYISDMTMSGSKVEGFETEEGRMKKIVVGKVLEMTKHPNADTLLICQVDVGSEKVQIVTGATNVVVGALVPVALHKSVLPNGTQIKRGKLRGEASEGMLCSLTELGLTQGDFPYADEEGILLIQEDCQVGDSAAKALGLDDVIVEFEITSNRPDCLSVLGLARETAATYGDKFTPPTPKATGGSKKIEEILSVTVENSQICQRYMAAAVEQVVIGASPRWMRERLRASGVRPINNIVDITNYVMLEYGHPMHAFDLRHVAGEKIQVRNANPGETITTLDGEERKLSPEMLVIADEKSASAIAGVMGGEYSGVYEDTTTVIFESACFDGPAVRRTARALGMRTESSGRFEKGLDSRNCENALKRACELVELLGAGTVADGFIDVDNQPYHPISIPFDPKWINGFVGVEIPTEDMVTYLDNLGFEVVGDQVVVPSFRAGDMAVPNDLAEEVARIYGYNNIPTTTLRGESKGLVTKEQRQRERVSATMVAQGYSEIQTYSFFSPKNYDKIRLEADSPLRNSVVIRNPLGEDTSLLRTTALPSMLLTLGYNYNTRNPKASLFELATRYLPKGENQQPDEPLSVLLGQYGGDSDFFTLKGGVEALLEELEIQEYQFVAVTNNPTYHTGRTAQLLINGIYLGVLGEIHPLVAENYQIGTRVFVAELEYEGLLAAAAPDHTFTPLPRFPASTRDLALVAEVTLPVGVIEETIRKAVGTLLEQIEIFDVYQGDQIPKGKKSVAFALTFRAGDRTLTDKELDTVTEKALTALGEIGVALRA